MAQKNPFTVSFGRIPYEYIPRPRQTQQILDMFNEMPVTDQMYMIVGVRGSGKTVMLNTVISELKKEPEWIVLKISPNDNILETLYRDLWNHDFMKEHFSKKAVNWKLKAGPVEVSSGDKADFPEPSLNLRIDEMLEYADKKKKKVLVGIDEITDSESMIAFSSALQIFIGNNRPVYFLGTALHENLERLRNVSNLTFLYRAPRIQLQPLDLAVISDSYQTTLGISEKRADQMAVLTKGYSFAYQALGFVYWENKEKLKELNDIVPEYDYYLSDFSYKKIWSELSEKDKKVSWAISLHDGEKVSVIREECGMSSGLFSVYRERLKNRGIINVTIYGKISFSLPRFSEFIQKIRREEM